MTRRCRPVKAAPAVTVARRNRVQITSADSRQAAIEAELRRVSATRVLVAIDEGRWPRRAIDLRLCGELVVQAARFQALSEEMAA